MKAIWVTFTVLAILLTTYSCDSLSRGEPLFGDDLSQAIFPDGSWEIVDDVFVAHEDQVLWTSGTTNPDGSEIPSWLPTPFAELPTRGTIGFQGKHGDSSISFKNVRIKEL
jgi:hypothetical protein